MNYSITVKEKLFSLINEMNTTPWLYTKNPETNFTRVKKWSFGDTIKFILSMEGKSLKDEILAFFNYNEDTPTNSSFNQRRAQIRPEAFELLFNKFTKEFERKEFSSNYRFVACDGSDLSIARNPHDLSTYFPKSYNNKGFNQLQLNALYDLNTRMYVDAVIQPGREGHEKKALSQMVDRYSGPANTVIIADRGYETYNTIAHIEQKGLFYLIRAKDIDSTGILHGFRNRFEKKPIFDEWVNTILTRRGTKEVLSNPHIFHKLRNTTLFDYIEINTDNTYELNMRVLRFPIGNGNYECIITNLPNKDFSIDNIRDLYHRRWGIETSFRELKYAIGLTNFHSKKVEYIIQEIWARLTLYNFCEIITNHIVIKKNRKNKYSYQINYTRAIRICCYFLSLNSKEAPPDIEYLIGRELLPIRPGRKDPRKVRAKSAVSFLYRVA